MPKKLPNTITFDIQEVLNQNPVVTKIWETLTPLSQNGQLCWITFFKKGEACTNHISLFKNDILRGKS